MSPADPELDASKRDRFIWRQDEFDEALELGHELLDRRETGEAQAGTAVRVSGRSEREAAEGELLDHLKQRVEEIDALLAALESLEEDGVYRYYHQSWEVYGLQEAVKRARELFEELAPRGTRLNPWLSRICEEGCAHQFDLARSNQRWQEETRPILEAFWHCLYFLRQLSRYGRELDARPEILPYGWAAILYMYGIR